MLSSIPASTLRALSNAAEEAPRSEEVLPVITVPSFSSMATAGAPVFSAVSVAYLTAGRSSAGEMDSDFVFQKNPMFSERADELSPLSCSKLSDVAESITVIPAYPGIRYPEIPKGVKYVIINTYHSGTLDTKSAFAREFFYFLVANRLK